MGDLKLPPATALPKVSSLIQGGKAQAVPVDQRPVSAPAARPGDQMFSRALPVGQASQALSFVETPAPPSEAELSWATDFEKKMDQGYKPSAAECQAYHRIADQLEASQPIPRLKPVELPTSDHESQWAVGLEAKVQSGQKPTTQELASYQNIAYRMLKADQGPIPHPGVLRQELDWALNLQKQVTETGYHPTAKQTEIFTDIFNRQNAPLPQPKASEAELNWAKQLYQRIELGYQPSPAEQERYNQVYQASQIAGSETVSAAEIGWSAKINSKVEQGYKPSQQEMDRFGDISRRLALQDPASIRPEAQVVSQHELDWAGQLQQMLRAGVPASDEEQQRYTQIYHRYSK